VRNLNKEFITHSLFKLQQVQTQSDAMFDVLKGLPAPSGERLRKDNAVVKIMLDHSYTRVGMY